MKASEFEDLWCDTIIPESYSWNKPVIVIASNTMYLVTGIRYSQSLEAYVIETEGKKND